MQDFYVQKKVRKRNLLTKKEKVCFRQGHLALGEKNGAVLLLSSQEISDRLVEGHIPAIKFWFAVMGVCDYFGSAVFVFVFLTVDT